MSKTDTIEMHVGHVVTVEVTQTIEDVIQIAKESRQLGRSKIDSVRKIYPRIAQYPREAIWYAIIHGVNLSSRGAVTYYYNMRKEYRT